MLKDTPLISVVIPVKNGAATLERALQGILAQTLAERTEIIVIDSGSTDGTLDIVRGYPVRLHEIAPEEFDHGATRNLGVSLVRGEFVVMTVQDAVPADERWLATMLRHFEDPVVMGVCGKQVVPHDPDKNPMQWHRPVTAPQVARRHYPDPVAYRALPPRERLAAAGWDDVTAMYRRAALQELPFRTTMFGEDFLWADDALARGWALAHDDFAQVCHYHHQSFGYRFRRMLTIYWHQYQCFGCFQRPAPFWHRLGQFTWHLARWPGLTLTRRIYWIAYNLRMLLAEWGATLTAHLALLVGGERRFKAVQDFFCDVAPQAKGGRLLVGGNVKPAGRRA